MAEIMRPYEIESIYNKGKLKNIPESKWKDSVSKKVHSGERVDEVAIGRKRLDWIVGYLTIQGFDIQIRPISYEAWKVTGSFNTGA